MKNIKKIAAAAFLGMVAFVVFPGRATAHRVYIYAWVEGNKVHTESYFSSGAKVRHGRIVVFGQKGEKLIEGVTDKEGRFSFPLPKQDRIRIVLDAAMGHRAEYVLTMSGYRGGRKSPAKKAKEAETEPFIKTSEDEIRAVVETVIEEKLRPITRAISRLERAKGPTVTEIVGGIGYIVGLMGIALYFKSKKQGQNSK